MSFSSQPTEFVRLWSEHSRHIYAYIYTLVSNWSDADDIFQETSVVLIEKFDEYQPGTNFTAWACRVAYLKTMEFFRERKSPELLDEDFLQAISQEFQRSPEEVEVRFVALSECLGKLAANDRKLIELRYRGTNDVKTTAARLSQSVQRVYRSLARIHETLYECIRRKMTDGENS
jgi:RNA polymerase sigma-70 factor (ECF subfamily)